MPGSTTTPYLDKRRFTDHMSTPFSEVNQAFERIGEIGRKIDEKELQLLRHGVLNGEARLKANEVRNQRAHLEARLNENSSTLDRATITAELQSLQNSFERWTAWTDRNFKLEPKE
jgi:hypothetical protein